MVYVRCYIPLIVTFRKKAPYIHTMSSPSNLTIQHVTGGVSVPGASPPISHKDVLEWNRTVTLTLVCLIRDFRIRTSVLFFLAEWLTMLKVFYSTFESSYFTTSSYLLLNPGGKQTEELPKYSQVFVPLLSFPRAYLHTLTTVSNPLCPNISGFFGLNIHCCPSWSKMIASRKISVYMGVVLTKSNQPEVQSLSWHTHWRRARSSLRGAAFVLLPLHSQSLYSVTPSSPSGIRSRDWNLYQWLSTLLP